tara:strand:+ start:715 stop:882 length:168 start_codon:yes stop_codon:yes gene_type:complete
MSFIVGVEELSIETTGDPKLKTIFVVGNAGLEEEEEEEPMALLLDAAIAKRKFII